MSRNLEDLYTGMHQEMRRRSRRAKVVKPVNAPSPITELPRRIRRIQRQAPMYAMQGISDLSERFRKLTGVEVIDMAKLMEVIAFMYRQQELSRRGANYDVDDFGFDREWTDSLLPIFKTLYHDYWKIETTGIEHVPAAGRALLVANHAGVLPWDGTMIKTSILLNHPEPRHARALVASLFFGMPVLSWFLRRTGQTVGHPDDTRRLLDRDELVLVFPEGVKGTGKLFRDRYRLQRFGRGGFVSTALRAGAPIIPISVVGSEEIYPMVANLQPVAKLFGLPYFPITPTWPLLGPLGLVPLPSRWRIQFHLPIRTDLHPPESADDQNLVMAISDEVRDTIQTGVFENLKLRRGTFG